MQPQNQGLGQILPGFSTGPSSLSHFQPSHPELRIFKPVAWVLWNIPENLINDSTQKSSADVHSHCSAWVISWELWRWKWRGGGAGGGRGVCQWSSPLQRDSCMFVTDSISQCSNMFDSVIYLFIFFGGDREIRGVRKPKLLCIDLLESAQ